jgi:hypothetical protein
MGCSEEFSGAPEANFSNGGFKYESKDTLILYLNYKFENGFWFKNVASMNLNLSILD